MTSSQCPVQAPQHLQQELHGEMVDEGVGESLASGKASKSSKAQFEKRLDPLTGNVRKMLGGKLLG